MVRAASDHVDALIHAAGLERSRSLPDKTAEEFDRIFDVKCDGWFHLLRAGIDMLPPAAGIATVRRELVAGASGEVLVAGALGALEQEWHATGGLDPHAVAPSLLCGSVSGMGVFEGLRASTRLDPREQPFLFDHRIDGTPVLPGVMGLEAFAEAARLAAPGAQVVAIEDVVFLAPFKFHRDEPREIEVVVRVELEDDALVAHCRLIGRRALRGQTLPQVTEHFRARVRLAPDAPTPEGVVAPSGPAGVTIGADAIYRLYFHGPAYRVLAAVWRDGAGAAGRFAPGLGANHAPPGSPLATAPRLLELCFQTAGILEIARTGSMGLPSRIDRIVFAGEGEPAAAVASVVPRADGRGFDAVVVDGEGRVRVRLEGYATAALPLAVDPALRAPLAEVLG
jgi:hypothetical protein